MFWFTSWDVVQSLQGQGGDVYARRCTFLNAGMSLCRNVLPFCFFEETNQQHFLTPPQKRSFNSSAKKKMPHGHGVLSCQKSRLLHRERELRMSLTRIFLAKNRAINQQKVQLLRPLKMLNMSLSSSSLSRHAQERYECGRNVCFQLTNFWSLKLYFCWLTFAPLINSLDGSKSKQNAFKVFMEKSFCRYTTIQIS